MGKIERIAPFVLLFVVVFIIIRYTIPLLNDISFKINSEAKVEVVEEIKYVTETEESLYERMDKEFEEKRKNIKSDREIMYDEIRKKYE